jgi:plastocyanin
MENKNAYMWTGIVVLVILVVWGAYAYMNSQSNTQPAAQQQGSSPVATATPTATPTPTATATPSSGATLSYAAAVKAYPYRIQFSSCHGTPGTLHVKVGSTVMLDNRDATAHTIKADTQTFRIAGYGYALLHTSAISSINITCDGGGAALLTVEK